TTASCWSCGLEPAPDAPVTPRSGSRRARAHEAAKSSPITIGYGTWLVRSRRRGRASHDVARELRRGRARPTQDRATGPERRRRARTASARGEWRAGRAEEVRPRSLRHVRRAKSAAFVARAREPAGPRTDHRLRLLQGPVERGQTGTGSGRAAAAGARRQARG